MDYVRSRNVLDNAALRGGDWFCGNVTQSPLNGPAGQRVCLLWLDLIKHWRASCSLETAISMIQLPPLQLHSNGLAQDVRSGAAGQRWLNPLGIRTDMAEERSRGDWPAKLVASTSCHKQRACMLRGVADCMIEWRGRRRARASSSGGCAGVEMIWSSYERFVASCSPLNTPF